MGKTILRILGAMITSYVGIGLVVAGVAALGLMKQLNDDYVTRMLGNAALGVVVTTLLLLYAHTVGGVRLHAFSFTWTGRDTLFAIAAAGVTFGVAGTYMLLLDRTGAHPLTWVAPSWAALAIGLIGQCGVLHEEVLARGYILMVVERRSGAARAIVVSALCFVLLHIPVRGVSFMVVSWLLGGLLYGYLYVKSGSLALTLAVHVLHNVAADLLMYSGNGVALVRFTTPLNGAEKIGYKVILTLLLFGLTYLIYGRGTRFLEPSRALRHRWAAFSDRRALQVPSATA